MAEWLCSGLQIR
ncbi:hypothetical protein D032_1863A, partial [Vibrio parahaemolyticus V14/01]